MTARLPAAGAVPALLLVRWHQLSGPGLDEALADRLSFRRAEPLTA